MYGQALGAGLVLGLIDIHMNNPPFLLLRLGIYTALASYQGRRYGGPAFGSVLLLGSSLAPIQMVAIAHGYQWPYVCRSMDEAKTLLVLNVPCFLGFVLGLFVRHISIPGARAMHRGSVKPLAEGSPNRAGEGGSTHS